MPSKFIKHQIQDLKKEQENQVQLLKQKQKSDEAAKRLQDEIQFIKAQKVQLQQKIKQEAEQFRDWKASREKELLQASLIVVVKGKMCGSLGRPFGCLGNFRGSSSWRTVILFFVLA
ncbi:unnamed protein product [Ilex paraguariensis]|uniref:Uncharacterized protein n=1 Tax=Ilex paraguariensis TaxID=185542 RepID=A0ABC8RV06_9AQUA